MYRADRKRQDEEADQSEKGEGGSSNDAPLLSDPYNLLLRIIIHYLVRHVKDPNLSFECRRRYAMLFPNHQIRGWKSVKIERGRVVMLNKANCVASLIFIALVIGAVSLAAGWEQNGGPICIEGSDQESPQLCTDGAGGAIIVWEDTRNYRDIYAQRVNARGLPLWTDNGVGVCTFSYNQYGSQIAPDGFGGAVIVWQDGRPHPYRDIYAQRITADGAMLWVPNGVAVCMAAENQNEQMICADGTGGCIVAWTDARVSTLTDIYAQRIDASGNPGWTADGEAICTADMIQHDPAIALDGKGGAIIAWADYRSGGAGSGDIYVQKIRPNGTQLWGTNGKVICSVAGNQYDPVIIPDGEFGAIVAWQDYRSGSFYDVYGQKVDSLGNALWGTDGLGVYTNSEWQGEIDICSDGDGGAIFTWKDNRVSDYDCYAQRIDRWGNIKWDAQGVAICDSLGPAVHLPKIVSDGESGAIITWRDSRDIAVTGNDIFAQHVDSLGNILWTAQGDSICKALRSQIEQQICSDGNGGAIIVWNDDRNANNDIFGQRITAAGDFVATLLQSHTAHFVENAIELTWTLSEIDEGVVFRVLRAPLPDGAFVELPEGGLERDGLSFFYRDTAYDPGSSYRYRVDVIEKDGRRVLFETVPIETPALALTLYQNHPNPFNPATSIRYTLPERCHVTLSVYDATGREICRLVDGEESKGMHRAEWVGLDTNGNQVASGIYFYSLKAGKETISKKMILLR